MIFYYLSLIINKTYLKLNHQELNLFEKGLLSENDILYELTMRLIEDK